jgi:hypothetical protein
MDANAIINTMSSLLSSGITTTGVVFVTLLALAGTIVVWVKL